MIQYAGRQIFEEFASLLGPPLELRMASPAAAAAAAAAPPSYSAAAGGGGGALAGGGGAGLSVALFQVG